MISPFLKSKMFGLLGKSATLLALLVVAFQLAGSSATAQNANLPEDFYDPQLLAFSDWITYVGDPSPPPIDEMDSGANWVEIDRYKSNLLRPSQIRWFRIDFTIGWHFRSRDIGLYLGSIEQAHEIYLNGRLIGGEGAFSPLDIDAAGKPSLTALPKLGMWYSFMNLSRSNTLLIGVQGLTEPLRFEPDLIQIDDMDRLVLLARSEEAVIKVIQGAAISILLLIASFCGFLFVSGFRGYSNVVFGLFVLVAAILIFFDSLLFYDFGFKSVFFERLSILGKVTCIILLCRLMHTELTGKPNSNRARAEMAILCSIAIGAVLGNVIPLPTLDLAADLATIGLFTHVLWASRSAIGAPNFEMNLMLALAVVVLAGCGYQLLFTSPNVSLDLLHINYLISAFTFLFLIARRYQDMSRHLSALSQRLVTVRDLERARMARDMHDGLGQGIVAVGLHLKILASGRSEVDFGNLTQSIDDLNLHVGEIIQNLRPSILKNQTLGSAIELHLEQTLTDTGLTYDCAVNKRIEIPFELKEQLFRIYQEALNNSIKHSGCAGISVEMTCIGRKLMLTILDDGKGFAIGENRDLGLGLSTMRERASLVNAAYTLDSSVIRGTKVQIEVQLDD